MSSNVSKRQLWRELAGQGFRAHNVISRFHPPSLFPPPIRKASNAMSKHFMSAGASTSTSIPEESDVSGYGREWDGGTGWMICKYGKSGCITASSTPRSALFHTRGRPLTWVIEPRPLHPLLNRCPPTRRLDKLDMPPFLTRPRPFSAIIERQ